MSNNKKGNGTIFKDNNTGKWRAQVTYHENGQTKRKSFTAKTKKEAIRRKDFFLRELEQRQSKSLVVSDLTIGDILKNIADNDYNSGQIKSSTYRRRLDTIKIINDSDIGNFPISEVSISELQNFLISLRSYSNSVIKKVFGSIKTAYNFAVEMNIVDKSPMNFSYIKKPKSNKPDKKVEALTIESQNKLLKQLSKSRFQHEYIDYNSMLIIEMILGCRMGEIAALKKDDVDLENHYIIVRTTITRGIDYSPEVGDRTKTPAGYRKIPFDQSYNYIFENIINNYKDNPNKLLFYDFRNNHPVTTQQVNSYFKRQCEKAGIDYPGGQHALRHTFATRGLEAKVNPKVIQKWMGHKDISTTLNTYSSVLENLETESVDILTEYTKNRIIAPKVQNNDKS